jgi:glycosyltransferase
LSSDRLVYVTFGSVAAGIGLFPMLYRGVVDAVADLPVRVPLTLGDAGDPEALGPLPANVHVERWWPQADVMPHASAMVGHGGMGTTLAGMVAGVPQVVVPLFADQPYNGARIEAIGGGVVLEGGPPAVAGLADALRRVLDEDWYRAGASRVAEQIGRLPPASDAVPLLEAVAASR